MSLPALTDAELEIIDMCASIWNKCLNLPVRHPDDLSEIRFHLHAIQNNLASRGVWDFLNKQNTEGRV